MEKKIGFLFVFLASLALYAQNDFLIENHSDKVTIPFKLIDNLIFIPIKVNGVELNFLLDSGVEETILFSMEEKKEVNFNNVEKIKLRGLGSEEEIEGLKSTNNILETHGLKSTNHLLYIILDQSFNLSFHIGIPVNGIIGYKFFKNNVVEVNYQKRKIIVYGDQKKIREKLSRRFEAVPITIERAKPYLNAVAVVDGVNIPAKLLIDIGNSDAFWIFENEKIKLPKKNFLDFLGKGFSGDIEGHRAKIGNFSIANFDFKSPIVAFPDSASVRNVKMVPNRIGSVGGEVLRRFTVVLDYQDGKLFLKKNSKYSEPFGYNKSGITVQHNGLQWVQETVHLETVKVISSMTDMASDNKKKDDFRYKFSLKPVYDIVSIRKNSAGEKCGLQKGDIILSINKVSTYKYSLQQINALLKSEEDVWINLEVERKSLILKFRFKLEEEL
jgi:hypothetical protein